MNEYNSFLGIVLFEWRMSGTYIPTVAEEKALLTHTVTHTHRRAQTDFNGEDASQ